MREALLFLMLIAAGFVASGLIASLYMLLSGQREYSPKAETDAGRLAAVGLTIFTGPSVLALGAFRRQDEPPPPGYRVVILMLVALWSYVLGLLVVSIALKLPSPF
jgi:hypothetical protein